MARFSFIALAVLILCSCRKDVDYAKPERCARVYATEVARMQREYVAAGVSKEDARIVELVTVIQDGEPLDQKLRAVIEHGIDFLYTNKDRKWARHELASAYVASCERFLGKAPA